MPIKLIIEVETAAELMEALREFVGRPLRSEPPIAGTATHAVQEPSEPSSVSNETSPGYTYKTPLTPEPEKAYVPGSIGETPQKRGRGRPRKTPLVVEEPEETSSSVDEVPLMTTAPSEPVTEEYSADPIEEPDEEDESHEAPSGAGELLKLKDETIAALQVAFASGNVLKVRGVLNKFGGGAKSFSEIAPEKFAAISAAIKGGALNDA